MTATTETTTTRTCPPSAVVDQIVRWGNVQDGDLVLCNGDLEPVTVLPYGNVWQPEGRVSLLIGGSWRTPRRDHYTAVRRYTEGSDGDALVLAALDEAAEDREQRSRDSGCFACFQAGDSCDEHAAHAERAAEYRELRDRLEAGR